MKRVFACCFASLLSAAAIADTTAPHAGATTFESLDRNGDHRISRTEAGMDKRSRRLLPRSIRTATAS